MQLLVQDLVDWLETQPCPRVCLREDSLELCIYSLEYLVEVAPRGITRQMLEAALDGSTLEEFICGELIDIQTRRHIPPPVSFSTVGRNWAYAFLPAVIGFTSLIFKKISS
jgi:hypothetical protein